MLAIIAPNFLILAFSAVAVSPAGRAGRPREPGPHGLSEILYAYTSGAGNNGSAFGGLSVNTPFYNLTLAADMLIGRFGVILPMLGVGGSLAAKKLVAPGAGSFKTDTRDLRRPPPVGRGDRRGAHAFPRPHPRADPGPLPDDDGGNAVKKKRVAGLRHLEEDPPLGGRRRLRQARPSRGDQEPRDVHRLGGLPPVHDRGGGPMDRRRSSRAPSSSR